MKRILSLVFLAGAAVGCGRFDPQLTSDGQQFSEQQSNAAAVGSTGDPAQQNAAGLARESSLPAGVPNSASQIAASAKMTPDQIFCPSGSWYSPSEKMCVTETQAIGPFTRAMVELCKKYGGGNAACEGARWERSFAARLRLDEPCPRGASFDSARQACLEGKEAFGPFKVRDVEECRRKGGGPACESMRWSASIISVRARGGTANKKLFDFYSVRTNYNSVFYDVLKFYPAGRSNGCVAFMSTALRRSGTAVPISEYYNGESVSLVTKPFSRYLTERLGWTKITSANNLQPGDVVMTEDDARYPSYPAHTYMFYGWSNQRAGIGWVIDNQDFIHERNIFGYGTYNFTPFAYALRSPD